MFDATDKKLRYSRQHLFRHIGQSGQEKLAASRVAVVGAGALGTVLANHMVRAGIGYVRIIDRDIIELSNLQRQMLYDEADAEAAMPKAEAAATKLRAINRLVTVEPKIADLVPANAEELLCDVDLILDGTDNFTARFLINDVAVKHEIPWVYGGAVGSRGMMYSILPGSTPCLHCLFPEPPASARAETCDTVGVIAPIVDIIASMQSTAALQILVGALDRVQPQMIHFDVWAMEWTKMRVAERRPDCPTCGLHQYPFLASIASPDTVSLCGRDTIQISRSQKSQLILTELAEQLRPLGAVTTTKFFVRANIEGFIMTIFKDGRALIQGTNDPAIARSLYARYVGA